MNADGIVLHTIITTDSQLDDDDIPLEKIQAALADGLATIAAVNVVIGFVVEEKRGNNLMNKLVLLRTLYKHHGSVNENIKRELKEMTNKDIIEAIMSKGNKIIYWN